MMMGSASLHIPIAFPHHASSTPLNFSSPPLILSPSFLLRRRFQTRRLAVLSRRADAVPRNENYTVGDFMTTKDSLHVVNPSTTVDQALDFLVEKRITGFPVVDDDWKLVGVVSDYDLLALDSISGVKLGGSTQHDTNFFPDVNSSWKLSRSVLVMCNFVDAMKSGYSLVTFNEIQKLLSKTNGKVVGDLMTPAPLVVRETTNLEDAARLLLETKYRRLPVVDSDGKLVGIITRGNVVKAALQIKRASQKG